MKYLFLILFALLSCKGPDQSGYAPVQLLDPTVTAISRTICGLGGGCSMVITGTNFFPLSVPRIGNLICENATINADQTQISCTVPQGITGTYDVTVTNFNGVKATAPAQFVYQAYVYAAVQSSPGRVVGYTQDPNTGALTAIPGSPFTSGGNGSYGITISPDNQFLYTTNAGSSSITAFSINSLTGVLTLIGTYAANSNVNGVWIDPQQRFLFASNYGNPASISAYRIATDGVLTSVGTYPASAGTGAENFNGITINNAGTFLFASAMGAGAGSSARAGIVVYSINASTGVLTQVGTGPFTYGTKNSIDGVATSNDDKFLYAGALHATDGAINVFSIAADGTLTGIQSASLGVFSNNAGAAVEIDPTNSHLYSGTYGGGPFIVAYFSIDKVTGMLTLQSPTSSQNYSSLTTAGGPNDVFIDVTGGFVYTCNSSTTTSLSQFTRNKSNGDLTKISPSEVTITGGPGIMTMTR